MLHYQLSYAPSGARANAWIEWRSYWSCLDQPSVAIAHAVTVSANPAIVHVPSRSETAWVSLCVPGAGVTIPDVVIGAGNSVAPLTSACLKVANWCG